MRKIKFLRLLFLFVSCTMLVSVYGQQSMTVTGKVTDDNGEPLPGVNIIIKGTTTGVVTDLDGNYNIMVNDSQNDVLQFNFLGFEDVEVAVNGQSTINATMKESSIGLDEVVAIGYGTVTRRDLTGAVSSVKTEQLKENPVANVAQALQGKLSGVAVTAQDGRPGADMKIRIRGGGSLTRSNDPLVVVDGVPGGDLSEIPADQIESIDVLKDASSTAIYGARGANGVILVTTKGLNTPKGKTTISYSGYYQIKEVAKKLETLNAQEYLLHQWSYATAYGSNAPAAIETYYGLGSYAASNENPDYQTPIAAWNYYANVPIHNYGDDLLRTAYSQDHNISITSSTEKTNLGFYANMTDDQGVKMKSGYKRHNVRLKLEHELYKNLKIGFDIGYVQSRTEGSESLNPGSTNVYRGSILSTAYQFKPIDNPLGVTDPIPAGFGNGDENLDDTYNPYTRTKGIENFSYRNKFGALGYINWEILKGLTFRSELSGNRNNREDQYYYEGLQFPDEDNRVLDRLARLTTRRAYAYRTANTISYDVQGLGDHKLSFLVGNDYSYSQSTSTRIEMSGFNADYDFDRAMAMIQYGKYYISTPSYDATGEPIDPAHVIAKQYFDFYNNIGVASTTSSYFGRLNYSYKGRYLFTATMRADGSSKFAPENQWGYFPATALAWRISDEPFMSGASGWLDNLKLRLSYGAAGNDDIPYYAWHALYDADWTNGGEPTFEPKGYQPNYSLKWETIISRNIGLDFNLLNNRIYGSIEKYWNYTKDLLAEIPAKPETGWTAKFDNIGRVSNNGIELSLGADIVRNKDLMVSVNATYNYNVNQVEELVGDIVFDYGTDWNSSSTYPRKEFLFKEGVPVGTIQGYVSEGFYSTDDFDYNEATGQYTLKDGEAYYSDNFVDLGNYPNPFDVVRIDSTGTAVAQNKIFPGALKIKDVNGDGEINEDDVTKLGQITPKHTGGFGVNVNYKGIDLSATFTYALGGHIYNIARLRNLNGGKDYTLGANRLAFLNETYKVYNVNDEGNLEAVTDPVALNELNAKAKYHLPYYENGLVLSSFIEKSDYLRLNTLTLGYTLPKQLTQKVHIQRFRVYVTGGNLLTITGYSGPDPEVNTREKSNSNALPTPGLDYGAYPRSRTFTFGVNVDF